MLNLDINKIENEFDSSLPKELQNLSSIYFTPVDVIVKAVKWLGPNADDKILDIGAGVGKFCIVGAKFSNAQFTGVELRSNLVDCANTIKKTENLNNVSFINANITSIDFDSYTSFYFYNPFVEHKAVKDWIDKSIPFSEEKHTEYSEYIVSQLIKKPVGTRVVTYFSPDFYLPSTYFAVEVLLEGNLVFWEKTH